MKGKTREDIAREEVGRTSIDSRLALVISLIFAVIVFGVPLFQATGGDSGFNTGMRVFGGSDAKADNEALGLFDRIKLKNTVILKRINQFERTLEEESFLRKVFLPPLQDVFLRLGQGNEKVVAGAEDWLFFRPGIDAIIGQPFLDTEQLGLRKNSHKLWEKEIQPNPVDAIVDFNKQLKGRGITLVVLPVPIKPSVHGEKLGADNIAPVNRSWSELTRKLSQNGVRYLDIRDNLLRYKEESGSAYLQYDTHWLPGAMEDAAKYVADYLVKNNIVARGGEIFKKISETHAGTGDIAKMLTLPKDSKGKKDRFEQNIEIHPVLTGNDGFWQPEREAEILLLGDSFTNIYSKSSLGWGRGAGFAEQLSFFLKQPVDLIAKNDSGAYITRESLSRELAKGRDRLAGKKVVIWQFAERELALGDWKILSLALGKERESEFYVIPSGGREIVTATIAAISSSPRPGTVPYRDNLVTIHLVDLHDDGNKLVATRALVYGMGMKDNQLTSLGQLRNGDTVILELSAWDDVEPEYGSYRRSPLDDEMMELELPNWGVLVEGDS